MAAYASLVSLARKLEQIHGEPNHILHLHSRDFKPLLETVVQLQATMENSTETTPDFEGRISDCANRADDIIDDYVSYLLRSRDRVRYCFGTKVRYIEALSRVILGHNKGNSFHHELQKLSDEAASLLVEAKSRLQVQFHVPSSSRAIGKVSVVPVGFDADLRKLREWLYGESSQREVISIVGMGGSGLTTLATALYEDSVNVRRFDRLAWITVSDNYDMCEVLTRLLSDLKGSPPYETTDSMKLGIDVFQTLKKRRYLIVLSDIWTVEFWDQIRIWLPDDGNRSRILLTTRIEDVAFYVAAGSQIYIHKPDLLDLETSWSLLKKRVFGEEDCPLELEEIGKAIAKNCGGLPLAIVVIAGLLSNVDPVKASWEKIAEDVVTSIERSDGNYQVMEILSLSYKQLPIQLKPCFLYLGRFPEDSEICVSDLMMLWVAEGFLKKPIDSERSEEDVAYEYLEHLFKKNLILVTRRKFNGQISWFRVHNLIRALCLETAQKEKFMYRMRNKSFSLFGIKNPRRLSICSDDFNYYDLDTSCIRSALYWDSNRSIREFKWSSFRLLRVLDAVRMVQLSEFPSQVCQLFHLKYIALTLNVEHDYTIPSSIYKLQNLQVLKVSLRTVSSVLVLPFEIWSMPQLRHLIFPVSKTILSDPPVSVGSSLENLQTLSGVVNFRCTWQVLQKIPNVTKLRINYCSRDGDGVPDGEGSDYYCIHNLVHLLQLEALKIEWTVHQESVQLPRSLKRLNLTSLGIPWKELRSTVGLLPNLEVLKLRSNACNGELWETREGEFPELKMLEIDKTDLVVWRSDDSNHIFPRLERLCLFKCYNLREVPGCIGEIETLGLIEIDEKNEFLVEWATQLQEEQNSYGNELLQIRITH